MPPTVAVVIAARNEQDRIAAVVRSALEAGADEVVLADGQSTDDTLERARHSGARIVTCPAMRSQQFNAGAATCTSDTLVFLHGDTTLPADAIGLVRDAVCSGAVFGGFRISFAEPGLMLRLVAGMINLRTRITRQPWGDQAPFVNREAFLASGGFREIPIMEDYELASRFARRTSPALLPAAVTTAGRRFVRKGVIATTAINWLVIAGYHLGVAPERLARIYRDDARR